MIPQTRKEYLAETAELASQAKTDHFCMAYRCIQCDRNTQIQMARNRLDVLVDGK